MIKLKDIFSKVRHGGDPATREILFEDGLWCIYKRIPQGDVDDKYNLIHRCTLGTKAVFLKPSPITCGCGTEAPEGILGLLKLQQWGTKDGRYCLTGPKRHSPP